MSHWILNRLIAIGLDNAAVLEAAAAMCQDGDRARRLRQLAGESAAAAQDVALLQHRLGGRPVLSGTPQGAARCRSVEQAATLGPVALPGVLALVLRSVNDSLTACEGYAALSLTPMVRAAVELGSADLRMARFELTLLSEGTPPTGGRPGTPVEIRFGLYRP
jgi:hypothetical protein